MNENINSNETPVVPIDPVMPTNDLWPKLETGTETILPIDNIKKENTKEVEEQLVKDFEAINKNKKGLKGKLFKGVVIFSGIGLVLIVLIAIVSIFKLDTKIFPVSAYGRIVDFNDKPLAKVSVCIQNKCASTDDSGNYNIEGLNYGSYELTVKFDKYRDIQETIPLQRGKNKIDRNLLAEGFGDIKGELSTADGLLERDNLEVKIDDQSITLNNDNTFSVTGRSIGKFTLNISSPLYKDVSTDYELTEGNFDVGKIVLVSAIDIKFNVVDWLSGVAIEKASVKIGTVSIETKNDGLALFTDMAAGGDLSILVHKDGYIDQTVKLTQTFAKVTSVNVLPDCGLVRSGRVVYVSNRLGNKNIYSSNYDSSDEKMLSDNKGDSNSPIILADGKTVAFFSTRDQVKNAYNNVIEIPYTADINGGKLTKLAKTNYEDNGGIGDYDFLSMKRVFLKYSYEGGTSKYEVYFGNLDGTGSNKIFEKSGGNFNSFSFANNGEFLVYGWTDYTDRNNNGFYYLKTSNSENKLLYKTGSGNLNALAVASDRGSVLVNITDDSSYTSDLWQIGINDNKVIRLTNSTVAEYNGRFSQDLKSVFYTSSRDGKSDLYRVNSNGTAETKITSDGKVGSAFLGNGGLAFYTSDRTLYIIDTNAPAFARKVTDNILNDSYTPYAVPD